MKTNIFLIENQRIIREGIIELLKETEINVVEDASSLVELKTTLTEKNDEILLIEMSYEYPEAISIIKNIRAKSPLVKILILSDRPDGPLFLKEMLSLGVMGYMTKNAGADEMRYGIQKIKEDGLYICTAFILKVLSQYPTFGTSSKHSAINLSAAEMDVLKLIAEGHTNKDIAQQLFTSDRTIETRRKKIIEKTNTTNTATLIKFALQNGLIS